MKKTPSQIIDDLMLIEGGYVNHPADRGGPTNFGITERVAREYGYYGPMQLLPKMTAKLIYLQIYWIKSGFAEVNKINQELAIKLFDAGVNVGIRRSSKWLQRGLNLFTNAHLSVDGRIGKITLTALQSYLDERRYAQGPETLIKVINGLQVNHYITLVEQDPKQRAFGYGWFRHRVL